MSNYDRKERKKKTGKLSSQQGCTILKTACKLHFSSKPTGSAGLTRPTGPTGPTGPTRPAKHNQGTIYTKNQKDVTKWLISRTGQLPSTGAA